MNEETFDAWIRDLIESSLKSRHEDTMEDFTVNGEERFQDTLSILSKLFGELPPTTQWRARCCAVLAYHIHLNQFGYTDGYLRLGPNLEILAHFVSYVSDKTRFFWSAADEMRAGGIDPDNVCRLLGGQGYLKLTEELQRGWMDTLISEGQTKGFSLDDPTGRLEIAQAIAYRIAMMPDAMTRDIEIGELAIKVRVSRAIIVSQVKKFKDLKSGIQPERKRWWK